VQDGLLLDTETFYTIAQQEILAGLGKVGSSSSSSSRRRMRSRSKPLVTHVLFRRCRALWESLTRSLQQQQQLQQRCINSDACSTDCLPGFRVFGAKSAGITSRICCCSLPAARGTSAPHTAGLVNTPSCGCGQSDGRSSRLLNAGCWFLCLQEFTWDLKAKMMGKKALDAAQVGAVVIVITRFVLRSATGSG
jgi:hypothetical protein